MPARPVAKSPIRSRSRPRPTIAISNGTSSTALSTCVPTRIVTGKGERAVLGGLSFDGEMKVASMGPVRSGAKGSLVAKWTASSFAGRPWGFTVDSRAANFATGYAEVDLIYIAPSGGGILQDLRVQRGDHVAAGAALFQVDASSENYSRQAALAQQSRAHAQLADLSKGRRSEEIAAIQAQLVQAKAAREMSTSQLKRQRELIRQGFVSASQLEELEATQTRDVEIGRAHV